MCVCVCVCVCVCGVCVCVCVRACVRVHVHVVCHSVTLNIPWCGISASTSVLCSVRCLCPIQPGKLASNNLRRKGNLKEQRKMRITLTISLTMFMERKGACACVCMRERVCE